MTPGGTPIARWKSPDDLKRWLSQRFSRLLAADLRTPGAMIEPFQIATPELSAAAIAQHFATVRAWVDTWSEMTARQADFEMSWTDWDTRNFGRVRIPRIVRVLSLDAAAHLLGRIDDATKARQRFESIRAADARLAGIADQWPAFVAMNAQDFSVLCRFLAQIVTQAIPKMRLREVPCAGMHTKFLESHRGLLVLAMAALEIPSNPNARSWAGKLGFMEDETRQFELRDLDGGLLPYLHFALLVTEIMHCPLRASAAAALRGIVIVENMDLQTAQAFKEYWVDDASRPGSQRAYEGLTAEERAAQQLMATGPWRLEQERIPFDLWVERLERWGQAHDRCDN